MNHLLKLFIGLLSIIPALFVGLFIINFIKFPDVLIEISVMFTYLTIVVILMIGLLTYYVVDIFNTRKIPSSQKTLWTIILFFGHVIAMPVYWYLYIWSDRTVE